jgi:hypothetical protein
MTTIEDGPRSKQEVEDLLLQSLFNLGLKQVKVDQHDFFSHLNNFLLNGCQYVWLKKI